MQMSMCVSVYIWVPCIWEWWGVDVCQLPNPSKPSDEKPCGLLSLKRTEEAGLPQWPWVGRRWCWLRGLLSSEEVALWTDQGLLYPHRPCPPHPACPREMRSLRRRAWGNSEGRCCPPQSASPSRRQEGTISGDSEHLPRPQRTYRSLVSGLCGNISPWLIECLQILFCVHETTLEKYTHLLLPDNYKDFNK